MFWQKNNLRPANPTSQNAGDSVKNLDVLVGHFFRGDEFKGAEATCVEIFQYFQYFNIPWNF